MESLRRIQQLSAVAYRDESPDVESDVAPAGGTIDRILQSVVDAYLAAFAIAGGYRLITLDKDFKSFVAAGLDLLLLEST